MIEIKRTDIEYWRYWSKEDLIAELVRLNKLLELWKEKEIVESPLITNLEVQNKSRR